MKTTKLTPYFLIVFLCFNALSAQTKRQIADGDRTGHWFLGLGLNLIDDDFTGSNGSSTNFSNPYILDAEYNLNNAFSFYGSLSFNKFVAGKVVDGRIVQEGGDASYMAFDLGSNFYFRKIMNSYTFEPYLSAGLGYTDIGSYNALPIGSTKVIEIPSIGRLTLNTGFGANYWLSSTWGMNVNLMAKFGINSKEDEKDYVSNQMQISFGVLYSLGIHN